MKKQMIKRICALTLIFAILFSLSASALDLSATGAYSLNCDTGEVYYEKNADVLMTPASLTKIMTLYIVFEKIAEGVLSEDTLIPVSQYAASISTGTDATNIPLKADSQIPLSTLIDAMTVVSACACCTVIGEYISGSEEAFALLMNEKAKELGIEAVFYDASGLSDDNLISPKGIATLINAFIKKYPRILHYTSKTSVMINDKEYVSTNKFLPISKKNYYYEGVNGFKTGTTKKAGSCLTVTAEKNGDRIITVVLHANNDSKRYADSTKLLDYSFGKALEKRTHLYSTDIRAFINNWEIPCSYRMVGDGALCITAEQLNLYGFDTHFDGETHTLYISENKEKELSPLPCDKLEAGLPEHKIYEYPDLKVILIKGEEQIPVETAVSLGGQCAISLDEFGSHFTKSWNGEKRVVSVSTQ